MKDLIAASCVTHAAADAIDVVFCRETNDMALLGISQTKLKNILALRAAKVLACSMPSFPPWVDVRQAAATALQSEEKYDFVPLLIALAESLSGPPPQVTGSPSSPDTSTGPKTHTLFRLDHGNELLLMDDRRTAQRASVLVVDIGHEI